MTAVMMPGGWHYDEGGKPIVEEAESYDDLINKLIEYRGFCGLPLGNPQLDVDKFICETYPNMCGRSPVEEEGVDKMELSYGVPVVKSPRERVMQWAANRMERAGQIEFVDAEEADRRAAICDQCPKKIQWNQPIAGCPGCQVYVEEAETKLIKLRRNKNSTYVLNLYGHSCTVAGHDLETACWLEEPALRHRKNYIGKFPNKCWLKDLKESE
jgi:hypothetical protein